MAQRSFRGQELVLVLSTPGSTGAKHTGVQLLHSLCDCGPAPSFVLGLVVHPKMGTIVASDADKAIGVVSDMWGYEGE